MLQEEKLDYLHKLQTTLGQEENLVALYTAMVISLISHK